MAAAWVLVQAFSHQTARTDPMHNALVLRFYYDRNLYEHCFY